VNRPARRRGQLLLVVASLLGAFIGSALGLVVESSGTGTTASARERGAALAAAPPSGQPPATRPAGSGDRAAAGESPGDRRASPADQPGKRTKTAGKDGEDGKDGKDGQDRSEKTGKQKPDKGKDK
jgi:hypothetical protein